MWRFSFLQEQVSVKGVSRWRFASRRYRPAERMLWGAAESGMIYFESFKLNGSDGGFSRSLEAFQMEAFRMETVRIGTFRM